MFTLPDSLPPIVVAAGGGRTATAAGEFGDGLITIATDEALLDRFEAASGTGDSPYVGQLDVRFAADEDVAIRTAHEQWPTTALPGELSQELRTPSHFEQAAELVSPENIATAVVFGSEPIQYIEGIQAFLDAGFTHVQLHQSGDNQTPFLEFMSAEVLLSFS